MRKNNVLITGLGVLCYDVVVRRIASEEIYLGGRSGGSTANFLSNCASLGASATFMGVAGEDHYSLLAIDDLRKSGVNLTGALSVPGFKTRLIFETLGDTRELDIGLDTHAFGVVCPCCNQGEPPNTLKIVPLAQFDVDIKGDVIYFDSISRNRARFIDRIKATSRRKCILDLGRIGAMRYMLGAEIISILSRFDLIFCSAVVARSLVKRAGDADLKELSLRLGVPIIVSDGKNGVQGISRLRAGRMEFDHIPAPVCDVKDTAGAGDAFFAGAVCRLIELGWHEIRGTEWKKGWLKMALEAGTDSARLALQCVGARGHLDSKNGLKKFSSLPSRVGIRLNTIRAEYESSEKCPICLREQPLEVLDPNTKAKRQMKVYLRNIDKLLFKMGFVSDYERSSVKYADLVRGMPTAVIVGTGGSFPVAQFLADLFSADGSCLALAMHPMQYARAPRKCDTLFVVSYSGGTSDCGKAITIAKSISVRRIVIVTGNSNPSLAATLRLTDEVVHYEDGGAREKGFVSIRGTVLPCSWFLKGSDHGRRYLNLITWLTEICLTNPLGIFEACTEAVKGFSLSPLAFDIYGSGYAMSSVSDFESKITEGGVGVVRIHESKDFSHGRFMSVMGSESNFGDSIGIVFSVGKASGYERKLWRSLEKFQRVIVVESRFEGMLGSLELLVLVQYMVKAIGETLGRDLSRPSHIPVAGLSLYRWKGSL